MTTPFFQSSKDLSSAWHMAIGPSATYVAALNKTIVTWCANGTGSNKSALVAAYDHTAGTWSERYVVGNFVLANDNHGYTGLCQDADGYFYVFYGSHATAQKWSISTLPSDISAWTQQPALSGLQTYPHPVVVGSTIYLFLRNSAVSNRHVLSFRAATPSSGLATFSGFTNIVDYGSDSRAYAGEIYAIGTDIHIICARSNGSDTRRRGVYYFIYDTLTGSLKNHDASVVTASASLPISLATADANYKLFDHGLGQGEVPSMCFDTNGDPHVIFGDNGNTATYTLKYITKTGGVWSAPINVDTIYDMLAGSGFTTHYGITAGPLGEVQAWYINAAGDKIQTIRYNTGVWGSPTTITTAGAYKLMAHQSVRPTHPDLRTIYCEVAATATDASAIYAKRYAHGDSGPLSAVIDMAPVDPLYPNVPLLLGFDHRDTSTILINDAESYLPITLFGNAQIDTSQSKYGPGSLLLDGSGDYLSVASNNLFSVSNGDFTVECYIRLNASKLQAIASKRPSVGSSEWACYIDATNHLVFQGYNSSVNVLNIIGTTALSLATWYHVAFSRIGNMWLAFLEGALEASGIESATPTSNSQALYIGRDTTSTRYFNGWIDEFRFTESNGRYSTGFTALTSAFPRR